MSRLGLILLFALTLSHPKDAGAHADAQPRRDRLELRPDGVALAVEYVVVAPGEARALVERFDRDGSGALDDGERAALASYLADEATRFLRLSVDGREVALERGASEPRMTAQRLATRVELGARVRLGDIAHSVQFFDRRKEAALTIPVQVVLRGLALAASLPPLPLVDADHPLRIDVIPAR